ncbi:hypothetical protein EY920_23735 [Citrobacter braakii]|uniref:hypothetical protein n=1 Tax=Citrobacter braakii TaxID=57706 RepID=UPI00103897AD|nr:hypothetical protein [Citrobacter braakii]TCC61523.1 hypothetical protein EY920_23735 [Citrobacter braakii]
MSSRENIERWVSEIDEDGMCDISDNQVTALIRDYNCMAVQLANAESKCRELAAECAGMKQLASEAYDEMVSHHDTDGLYSLDADGEQMDALIRLCDAQATIYDTLVMCETPATDAFLSEVRAQGVERMIEVKQQQLDGMHPDTFAIGAVRDSIRRDIYELKVFAEILRQEAAQ